MYIIYTHTVSKMNVLDSNNPFLYAANGGQLYTIFLMETLRI